MSKSKSGGPEEEERNGSSSATATTTTTTNSSYDAEAEAWSRVQLLRARLRAAAAAEDYEAASALRDALAAAVDALPLPQRHVLSALDAASSSLSTSSLDRASALLRAADHVRPYAFAQLATFLHDPDAGVAAAAERSLATAFRVPPDEAAAARMDEGDRALEQAATMMALGGGRGGAAAMEEEEDEEEATTSSSSGGLLPRRRQRSRGRSRSELLQRALAAYSACAELHPLYAEAHNAKATALYVAGDPVASLRACEVVLDLNPHHFSCAAGERRSFFSFSNSGFFLLLFFFLTLFFFNDTNSFSQAPACASSPWGSTTRPSPASRWPWRSTPTWNTSRRPRPG